MSPFRGRPVALSWLNRFSPLVARYFPRFASRATVLRPLPVFFAAASMKGGRREACRFLFGALANFGGKGAFDLVAFLPIEPPLRGGLRGEHGSWNDLHQFGRDNMDAAVKSFGALSNSVANPSSPSDWIEDFPSELLTMLGTLTGRPAFEPVKKSPENQYVSESQYRSGRDLPGATASDRR
jgi:hypothetical protein